MKKLTKTEVLVLAKLPVVLDLGWVSNPLVYSRAIRSLIRGRREFAALHSLVARGALRLERVETGIPFDPYRDELTKVYP